MHPLTPDLSKLTDEELYKRQGDLQNKLMFAYRMGQGDMASQLHLVLDDYNMELQTRNQRLLDQANKDGKSFSDKIDITK